MIILIQLFKRKGILSKADEIALKRDILTTQEAIKFIFLIKKQENEFYDTNCFL